MEKIILTQPHTHAGVLHAIGAEIEVLLHDAEWLIERGIAKFVPGLVRRTAPPELPAASAPAPSTLASASAATTTPTEP